MNTSDKIFEIFCITSSYLLSVLLLLSLDTSQDPLWTHVRHLEANETVENLSDHMSVTWQFTAPKQLGLQHTVLPCKGKRKSFYFFQNYSFILLGHSRPPLSCGSGSWVTFVVHKCVPCRVCCRLLQGTNTQITVWSHFTEIYIDFTIGLGSFLIQLNGNILCLF